MQEAAEAGIAATAGDSLARRRLTQMRDFTPSRSARSRHCWTAGMRSRYPVDSRRRSAMGRRLTELVDDTCDIQSDGEAWFVERPLENACAILSRR